MHEYNDIIPVRGPAKYSEGDWHYVNEPKRSLEHFIGVEEIYKGSRNNVVYRADYHGGTVGDVASLRGL